MQVDYTEPEIRYDLITGSGDDPYDGLDRFDRVVDCLWENYGDSVDAARIKYGYDRVSNRTWRENPVDTNRRYDQLYAYDGLYRLTDFRQGELNTNHDGINDENFRQTWNPDTTGNWSGFNQDDDGNSTWDLKQTRDANKVNEIVDIADTVGSAWIEPQYDPAGNMTTMPQPDSPTAAFLATYDAWNRLVRIAVPGDPDPVIVAEYQYDGRTFRTLAREYDAGSLDHVRHFYYSDAWQVLEERLDSSTDADRQYVWGIRYIDDLILRDRDVSDPPNGTLDERLYALQDDNWNVIAICDAAGDVQERYEYEAYGKPVFLTAGFGILGASAFDWETLFAGYRLNKTRQFSVRYRTYSFALGRWCQRDPFDVREQQPVTLYEYSQSDPLLHVDPLGLAPLLVEAAKRPVLVEAVKRPVLAKGGGRLAASGSPPLMIIGGAVVASVTAYTVSETLSDIFILGGPNIGPHYRIDQTTELKPGPEGTGTTDTTGTTTKTDPDCDRKSCATEYKGWVSCSGYDYSNADRALLGF